MYSIFRFKNKNFFQLVNFTLFVIKSWLRIRIDLNCWINIRLENQCESITLHTPDIDNLGRVAFALGIHTVPSGFRNYLHSLPTTSPLPWYRTPQLPWPLGLPPPQQLWRHLPNKKKLEVLVRHSATTSYPSIEKLIQWLSGHPLVCLPPGTAQRQPDQK